MPSKPSERAEARESSEERVGVAETQGQVQKPNPSPKSNPKSNRKSESERAGGVKANESSAAAKASGADVVVTKANSKDRGQSQAQKAPNKSSERGDARESSKERVAGPEGVDSARKPNSSPKSNPKSNRKSDSAAMDKTSDPEADKARVASKERSESQAQKAADNSEAQEASEDGASVPEGDEASQKPNPSPKSGGRANRRSESSGAEGDENKSASRERGDLHSQKTNLNNLIVKFLPPSMNSEGLYSLFSEHGELESCKVATNKNSGASLGYGFVRFKNDWAARSALIDLNGTYIQGKVLKVTYVDKAKKENPERGPEHSESVKSNIYVASLPHDWSEQDLKQYFGVFGAIQNCKVLLDSHGESRNVGFVQFENLLSSARAISEVNGIILPGAVEAAIVKYARDASSSRLAGKDGDMHRPRKPKRQNYPQQQHYAQSHVSSHANAFPMAHPSLMSSYLPYGMAHQMQPHLAHTGMPVNLADGSVAVDRSHIPLSTSPSPDAHMHPHAHHVSPMVPGADMAYTTPEMGVHMAGGNPSTAPRMNYFSLPMGNKPLYAGRSPSELYMSAPPAHPQSHIQPQHTSHYNVMGAHGYDSKKQEYAAYPYAPMYGHPASLPVFVDGHSSYVSQEADPYTASTSHHVPSQHSQAHSTHPSTHPTSHTHTAQSHIISGLAPERTE